MYQVKVVQQQMVEARRFNRISGLLPNNTNNNQKLYMIHSNAKNNTVKIGFCEQPPSEEKRLLNPYGSISYVYFKLYPMTRWVLKQFEMHCQGNVETDTGALYKIR